MFRSELNRLWQSRLFKWLALIFIVYSIAINAFPLFTNNNSSFNETMESISDWDLSDEETLREKAYRLEDYDVANNIIYVLDLKERAGERKTNLEQMQQSFLFSSAQDQAEIANELEVVTAISNDEVKIVNDLTAIDIFNNAKYDFFVLLVISFYIIYCLISEDQDGALLRLYDTTIKPRKKRILAKFGVYTLVITAFVLLKLGISLLTIKASGLELSLPIHYIYGYDSFNFYCLLGSYLTLMSITKLLCVLSVIGLFTIALLITNNNAVAMFLCGIFLVIEYLIARFVSITSSIAFLAIYNVFDLAIQESLSSGFFTVSSFSIARPIALLIMLVILSFVLYFIVFMIYGKEFIFSKHSVTAKTWRFRSLAFFLNKDFWFSKKGLFIYLAIAIYCFTNALQYSATKTYDEQTFINIRQEYFGTIDDELIQRVNDDLTEAQEASSELTKRLNSMTSEDWLNITVEESNELNDLQSLSYQVQYINRVKTELESLVASGATYYYIEEGIELFVNKKGTIGGLIEYILVILPVLLMSVAIVAPIYQTNIYKLLFSTKQGKNKYLRKLFTKPLILTIITYLTVFALRYYKLVRYYTVTLDSGLATDILGVNFPFQLPIYLILMAVSQILFFITLIIISMTISKYLDRLSASAIMIMIAIVSILLPFGPGILFRYDMINHLFQYLIVMGLMIAYLTFTAVNNIKRT